MLVVLSILSNKVLSYYLLLTTCYLLLATCYLLLLQCFAHFKFVFIVVVLSSVYVHSSILGNKALS